VGAGGAEGEGFEPPDRETRSATFKAAAFDRSATPPGAGLSLGFRGVAPEWRNWAGDQRCSPAAIEHPTSREELGEIVAMAAERGQTVRASASGHSFSDVALTDGIMVRLDRLDRVLDFDAASGLIRVEAGIVLRDLNRRLDDFGVAFENLGDIDRQSLAGSIATATHGTGARFQNLSAQVETVELVLPDGSELELSAATDPDAFLAARVGLGALGIVYAVTVRTVPAYTIDRLDNPKPLAETLAQLDQLVDANDHFELYVFPHTGTALCRESRRTTEPPRPRSGAAVYFQEVMVENWVGAGFAFVARHHPDRIPQLTRFVSERLGRSRKVDRSHRVFASERRIKFTEMEYGIPRRHGREAVERVLEVAARPELGVSFPVEVRFVAADDALLSPSHDRETCYIAVHHDRVRPKLWERYFRGVEEIMSEYGGRPHWGKRHFHDAATLTPLYPRWEDFQAVRARLDPAGVFGNAYTERVLGPVRSS
jgi:L-gulono-1,4-lactone dehydrogenase